MRVFGHYETVPVRGTHRKAKVYIPSLLKHILVSLAIASLPFAVLFSSRPTPEEAREELRHPLVIGFFLVMFLAALMAFWVNRLYAKDARRMLAGELEARIGVLWAIGQQSSGKYSGPCRLVIETQDVVGNPLRNEIYGISEKLYKEFSEKRSGSAWLVELAVLPPLKGPEFSDCASPGAESALDPMGFGEMPVFRGEVAEIFYLERQPYGCVIDRGPLFSHY